MRQNAMVPRGWRQTSVLQQSMPPLNAMAAKDYSRILPGAEATGGRPFVLPSQNGTSGNTWEQNSLMRLQGRFVI